MIRSEISTGHLTRAQHEAFMETLTTTYEMRVEMRVLNADEKEISSLTAPAQNMLSGAVQVDTTQAVARTLQATLLDPNRRLRFEANSPAHGAVFADNFLAVRHEVWVPERVFTYGGKWIDGIGEWVSTPVFHGPISNYQRNGREVSVQAQGMEALMLAPYLTLSGYPIPKGTRLDDALRMVGQEAAMSRFDIPDLKHKLGRTRNVKRESEPWLILVNDKDASGLLARRRTGKDRHGDPTFERSKVPGLVESIPGHWTAFTTTLGAIAVRRLNHRPSYRLTEEKWINDTSPPERSYDVTKFRNYVIVIGGKQLGHKRAEGHAALPANHPLSPHRLRHNGEPRYLIAVVRADNLTSDKQCEKRAAQVLKRLQLEGVDLQLSCAPLPMLEETDVLTAKTRDWSLDWRPRQWTVPLTSDSDMSIGFHKRVQMGKRRHRSASGGRAGPPGGTGGRGRKSVVVA